MPVPKSTNDLAEPDAMSGWCYVFADDSLHYYSVGQAVPMCGRGVERRKRWVTGRADLCPLCHEAHIELWLNKGGPK